MVTFPATAMPLHLACTSANCHVEAELSDKKAKSRELEEGQGKMYTYFGELQPPSKIM